VRFSDVGWTDVTATTPRHSAIALHRLLADRHRAVRSRDLCFVQNNDIDVFLGNWMPAQEADRARYVEDGSVVVIGPNLTGAKYTLAVPAYTYAAACGTSRISSASRGAQRVDLWHRTGNDGNRHVLEMLKQSQFGWAASN